MTEKVKLKVMEEFTIDHIKKNGYTLPGVLASAWYKHKNGRFPPSSSRDRIGITSAAYRTLRQLRKLNLVEIVDGRWILVKRRWILVKQ